MPLMSPEENSVTSFRKIPWGSWLSRISAEESPVARGPGNVVKTSSLEILLPRRTSFAYEGSIGEEHVGAGRTQDIMDHKSMWAGIIDKRARRLPSGKECSTLRDVS